MIVLSGPEVRFAIQAVFKAMDLAHEIQSEAVRTSLQKQDRSPVTLADLSIQALMSAWLEEAFPEDALVAEEDSEGFLHPDGASLLKKVVDQVSRFRNEATGARVGHWLDRGREGFRARTWILDPIDGTKGFLRGEHYAVSLAILVENRVQMGVIGCPHWSPRAKTSWQPYGRGALVVAVRGQGAWWLRSAEGEMRRLGVSAVSDPRRARLLGSSQSGHTDEGRLRGLLEHMGIEPEPWRFNSQTKYAVLASGRGDLLVRLPNPDQPEYREKIWDQAAPSLLIAEAGGRMTDSEGRELDFGAGRQLVRNRGILASNGLLHDLVVAALERD